MACTSTHAAPPSVDDQSPSCAQLCHWIRGGGRGQARACAHCSQVLWQPSTPPKRCAVRSCRAGLAGQARCTGFEPRPQAHAPQRTGPTSLSPCMPPRRPWLQGGCVQVDRGGQQHAGGAARESGTRGRRVEGGWLRSHPPRHAAACAAAAHEIAAPWALPVCSPPFLHECLLTG